MRRSSKELGEAERKVLSAVRREPGMTLAEIAERTGLGKYDTYRAVRALSATGLVRVAEGDQFDPYSPSMTREVYPTTRRASEEEGDDSVEEGAGNVMLVATHPNPPQSGVVYMSFLDAFEVMVSEGESICGITGYLEPNALRRLCSFVAQKCKKYFELRLVCGKVFNDEYLESTLEMLNARGVEVFVKLVDIAKYSNVHAKFFVSGPLVYVGSHNITEQSFTSNLEVGVLFRDRDLSVVLSRLFLDFWRDEPR